MAGGVVRGWVGRAGGAAALSAALSVGLAGCGVGSAPGGAPGHAGWPERQGVSESPAAGEPAPRLVPDLEDRVASSCDYVLGDHTTGPQGYGFIGAARVENTGTVGVMAAVQTRWLLLGDADVRQHKTLPLGVGQTRRVRFSAPATRKQIDQHQAISPGRNCQVRVSIVGSFGDRAS